MYRESWPQIAHPGARIDLLLPRKISLYIKKEILSWRPSSRGPFPCSRLVSWGSPTRNGARLRGDTNRLNWAPPRKSSLHMGPPSGPNVITPAVKMALQNSSCLPTSRNSLIVRRKVPVGCSINGGLPSISSGTWPPRHNLQNNQKFRHKWWADETNGNTDELTLFPKHIVQVHVKHMFSQESGFL